jgi:hypothetical protein
MGKRGPPSRGRRGPSRHTTGEPLLISGHRVAATFANGGSGIAVTFFLDTNTGQLVATSRPGPSHHRAISGPGEFLIGFRGLRRVQHRPLRRCRDRGAGVADARDDADRPAWRHQRTRIRERAAVQVAFRQPGTRRHSPPRASAARLLHLLPSPGQRGHGCFLARWPPARGRPGPSDAEPVCPRRKARCDQQSCC